MQLLLGKNRSPVNDCLTAKAVSQLRADYDGKFGPVPRVLSPCANQS